MPPLHRHFTLDSQSAWTVTGPFRVRALPYRRPAVFGLLSCVLCIFLSFACSKKNARVATEELTYAIGLDTLVRGENDRYMWTHARSAAIPGSREVITTMSMTLKSGSDVYHDLYQMTTQDLGENWSGPEVIPSLKVQALDGGYRSLADMWPQWHRGTCSKTVWCTPGSRLRFARCRAHKQPPF